VDEGRWSEDELALVGWQWAPDAMKVFESNPDLWKRWLEHANGNINPAHTNDSKVGKEMSRFTGVTT
jgi:hypothetical protein